MKHVISAAVACAALTLTMPAHAETSTAPNKAKAETGMKHEAMKHEGQGKKYSGPAKTRQEAIDRVKERLNNLEKMTDEQWNERKNKGKERREKMKDMTPEEREKLKEKFQGMRDEKAKQ